MVLLKEIMDTRAAKRRTEWKESLERQLSENTPKKNF